MFIGKARGSVQNFLPIILFRSDERLCANICLICKRFEAGGSVHIFIFEPKFYLGKAKFSVQIFVRNSKKN